MIGSGRGPDDVRTRGRRGRLGVFAALLLACVVFTALGTWQMQRRTWKLSLIDRVQARVGGPVSQVPDVAEWAAGEPRDFEYRHVRVQGTWLHGHVAWSQAVTTLGGGFWQMVPMQLDDGRIVWINRGFVGQRAGRLPAPGSARVDGLLRLSEPNGGFLRDNDPVAGRWHSRDVVQMSAAQGLPVERTVEWFVDAQATPGEDVTRTSQLQPEQGEAIPTEQRGITPGTPAQHMLQDVEPVPGLTVLRFSNPHLVYALTWYGLALMSLGGAWVLIRRQHAA